MTLCPTLTDDMLKHFGNRHMIKRCADTIPTAY